MKRKKFSLKLFYIAFFIEMIFAYVMPFRMMDGGQAGVGFPLSFITIHDTKQLGFNPMMSMHLNPLMLLVDTIIIMAIIYGVKKLYKKYRKNRNDSAQEE